MLVHLSEVDYYLLELNKYLLLCFFLFFFNTNITFHAVYNIADR